MTVIPKDVRSAKRNGWAVAPFIDILAEDIRAKDFVQMVKSRAKCRVVYSIATRMFAFEYAKDASLYFLIWGGKIKG